VPERGPIGPIAGLQLTSCDAMVFASHVAGCYGGEHGSRRPCEILFMFLGFCCGGGFKEVYIKSH
jgi:hypothetical protein